MFLREITPGPMRPHHCHRARRSTHAAAMASDDAPVLVGGVLLGGLGVARLSVSVAAFFFRAWLAVMRAVWRQAHFAVGAALVVVAGTGLALLFDWNVALTVTALAVTNGWLFLPTSDLVWMARRGYVSPACVRLALSAVAAAMGADEVTEKRELRREARLVAKLERYRDWQTEEEARRRNPNAGRTRGGGVDATPTTRASDEARAANADDDDASSAGSDDDDDGDDASSRRRRARRRAKELSASRSRRFVKRPIRIVLRAILRLNGLVPFANETEEQARRRKNGEADCFGAFRGDPLGDPLGDRRDGAERSSRAQTRDDTHPTNGRASHLETIPKRPLPDPATWPHRPVFVRFSPRDGGKQRALAGWATPWGAETGEVGEKPPPPLHRTSAPVNTETAMAFESELFVGTIVCRFKGIACPANPSATKTKDDFFRRKRCTFQVVVQGKFKERVRADLVLTGGEFHRPFTERPPNYLVSAGCKFFAALTPGLELDLLCDQPFYTATLGGTVTTLSVDAETDAPDPLSDVKERNGRLGGAFANPARSSSPRAFADAEKRAKERRDAPDDVSDERSASPSNDDRDRDDGVSVARRCRVLGDPNSAKAYHYNTTDVYTFDYFQSVLLFEPYCLDIGIVKLKLDRHVDGQPLGIMAKHADGRYVYNFEIFHECLLPKTEQGVETQDERT